MRHIAVIAYSLLLIIGGIIGHRVANSLASIITSVGSALLLLLSLYLESKYPEIAKILLYSILSLLTLFFAYRWIHTGKLMPGGMLFIISAIVLAIAFLFKK
jgi:uncharacterized membrane protein (UPF0136 family)